ncbi:MAG: hypothetical protein WCF67_15575 [Chitinophagaceae bacterium]
MPLKKKNTGHRLSRKLKSKKETVIVYKTTVAAEETLFPGKVKKMNDIMSRMEKQSN